MDAYSFATINPGKKFEVAHRERVYRCFAIRTKLVTSKDSLHDVVKTYAGPHVRIGDIVFLSEKMVGCTQGRTVPMASIIPGFWARLLSRFPNKSPHGIGLSIPETMQCAIDEVGLARILLASAAGALGRLLRVRGLFYRVAGWRVSTIDGPCENTIAPLNTCVSLSPLHPDAAAQDVSQALGGNLVLVVDINDLGGRILGASEREIDAAMLLKLLRQNPLGQGSERTPIGILRPMPEDC